MRCAVITGITGQDGSYLADFLLNKGIALRIDKTSDIGEEIEILLKSSDRLADMSRAAFEHSRPHAALDIAKLILEDTN